MSTHSRSIRPRLERLEGRDNPGVLTVTQIGHTLQINGDAGDNTVTVHGDAIDPSKFTLSSTTDTFAGSGAGPFTGVFNLRFSMADGNDTVSLNNGPAIHLLGTLTVLDGDGGNTVNATDLTVDRNVVIRNGTNTSAYDVNVLTNVNVGQSLSIHNGNGNTENFLVRTSSGISTIAGALTIVNGSGQDYNTIFDVNVGRNVTINNGHGDGSIAGWTRIYNEYNTDVRSYIGGNVSITYLDGNGSIYDGIWDAEIQGSVSFHHGPGNFTTHFDGYTINLPVVINGSLTMVGTGANTIDAGTQFQHAGMVVRRNLTIASGSNVDSLTFNKLQVNGNTKLLLGDGDSNVKIDDSTYIGTFTLINGAGNDNLLVETAAGSDLPTKFEKPVLVRQGDGTDTFAREGGNDANQEIIVDSTFVVHYGNGGAVTSWYSTKELFPFGTSIEWVY